MKDVLQVESPSIRQFSYDLASGLGVRLIEKNYEFLCPIPAEIGSGYIKTSEFDNGIAVIELNGIFPEVFRFGYKIKDSYLTRIVFNLNSSITYRKANREETALGRFDSVLHACYDETSFFSIPPNAPVSLFLLDIQGDSFAKKMTAHDSDGSLEMKDFLGAIERKEHLFSKGSFTLEINSLITNFQGNTYSGPMRYIYQEAKANEIIIERIRQYIDDQQGNRPALLRKSTIKSIERAAQWISGNLDTKKTIVELAREVGLSANTLQMGFRHQFGCSVNDFIVSAKLKKAIELLENGELNITEITYELGIGSKSYFAKIFSERYGVSPSEYRKMSRTFTKERNFKND